MKELFGSMLLLCLLITTMQAQEMKLVSEFEGGKQYKAGKISVVVMKGNFYEMGR